MHALRLQVVATLIAASAAAQQTARWPQFRGPQGTAVVTETIPASLAFDLDEDVRYRAEIPTGSSSPCIWGDKIFLTGETEGELVMFALDRASGRELWRHGVPAPSKTDFLHVDASVAIPTPCTDGERVIFYFATHGITARDMDGELLWQHELPAEPASYGVGTSPVIVDDMVILVRDGCPDAALYAFDKQTGEERWKVPRVRYRVTHATPFLWRNRERTELVVASTGRIEAFSPADGKPLWQIDGLTPLICPTPTADTDTLFFAAWSTPSSAGRERLSAGFAADLGFTDEEVADPSASYARLDADGDGHIARKDLPDGRAKDAFATFDANGDGDLLLQEWRGLFEFPTTGKNAVVAIAAGGSGNITDSHVRWEYRRGIPYVSSPLLFDDRLYLLKAGGVLSCLDPESGEPVFRRHRLGDNSEYYASPIGVGAHIIVCASAGTIYVLESADEPRIVTTVQLDDERIFATPAVVDGTIYVRTNRALWAFGGE